MIVNDCLIGAAGGAITFGNIGSLLVDSGMTGFIVGAFIGVLIMVSINLKRYGYNR